jgi:hypothetical protein
MERRGVDKGVNSGMIDIGDIFVNALVNATMFPIQLNNKETN